MKKLLFAVAALFLLSAGMNAQKLRVVEGDEKMAFLKGETNFNLVYDYEGMYVGKEAEVDYKKRKVDDFNKKQPGKGDRWAEKWVNSRSVVYEPMFEELINKILFKKKTNATAAKNKNEAKYTVVVKTTMTEPGFNSFVMKVNPSANYEVHIKETAGGKVVYKANLMNVAGIVVNDNDYDFDPSNRIKECYAKAGKVVGTAMAKALTAK
jgi:hypothetical protein